jgi:hypothetical protein
VTRQIQTLALVFGFALASTAVVRTQDKAAPSPAASGATPIKVQVVISRYQGEKKISSMPYGLSVTGGGGGVDRALTGPEFVGRANLRMGVKVPIAMMAPTSVDGKPVAGIPTGGPIQYQDVGTNIDCAVWSLADGRFRVEVGIEDTSIYPDEKDTPGVVRGSPSFRSFRASDAMLLKDGATGQFTTATDKVSGDVVKVDVTLTVVK